MIEIPNLDQPSYDQDELDQLQIRYNRGSTHDQISEPASENDVRMTLHSDLVPLYQTNNNDHTVHGGLDLPIDFAHNKFLNGSSLPSHIPMTTNSPLATELYFQSHKEIDGTDSYTAQFDPNDIIEEPEMQDDYTGFGDQMAHREPPQDDNTTVSASMHHPDNFNGNSSHSDLLTDALAKDQELYNNTRAFMISPNSQDTSDTSIALSDYMRELEIDPQEVHYSSATRVHVKRAKAAPHPLSQAIGPDSVVEDINAEVSMETVSDVELVNASPQELRQHPLAANPVDLHMPTPLISSLSQEFASPKSNQVAYIEPSPQLPPPLSTKSLKQAFANFQEFFTTRKGLATELKNPAEYTLHIVFTQFVRHAERKLNMCLDYPLLEEPLIIEILAEGVDLEFDHIISSLGYIAKRKPKPVIDSVMFWRKSKSEVAARAASEVEKIISLSQNSMSRLSEGNNASSTGTPIDDISLKSPQTRGKRSLSLMRSKSISKLAHRRNNSASVLPDGRSSSARQTPESYLGANSYNREVSRQKHYFEEQIAHAQETAVQAERKSLASIYILCRVLIEVVKQSSEDTMGDDLGGKLEEIVYNQLRTTDPVSASESFVRLANWNLFAELLGFMSEKRFLSVSDRFIADLERIPENVKHDEEPSLHLLIYGMRYLKLTNYHLDKFEESAEFIQSLTKFFSNCHNQTLIYAYAEVLSNLILPLASILTAEANHPIWVDAVTKIYTTARRLWSISNSAFYHGSTSSINLAQGGGPLLPNNDWDISLTLMTSALCVAPKELFADNWFLIIENNVNKLKLKGDPAVKTKLMVCLSRLIWVYINRLPDTLNNTIKKLDNLFDLLFFGPQVTGKKQQWISPDINLLNALSEIIRIVSFQHSNYVLDNVILKLLKSSFNGVSLENMYTEKLTLVVKSYMLCLQDNKLSIKPSFPTDEYMNERFVDSMGNFEDSRSKSVSVKLDSATQRQNRIMFDNKQIKNQAAHEDICQSFASLLMLLDNQIGMRSWTKSEGSLVSAAYSKSLSSFSSFHFGQESSNLSSRDVQIELFASLLSASAWSIVPLTNEHSSHTVVGVLFKTLMEIFVRNAIHDDSIIALASINALGKLAARKSAGNVILTYARIAFRLSEKPGRAYESEYFNSENFVRLLQIYVDLLKCWLNQFSDDDPTLENRDDLDHLMNNEVLNDLYQINHKASDLTNLEPPSTKLKPYEELEWKTIITVIEEVEGNGLFFLCSNDSRIRLFAISILKVVEQFDQSIYNSTNKELSPSTTTNANSNSAKGHSRSSSKYVADEGTRLIQVMENQDILELIKPIKHEMSVPERTRLSKIKNKKGTILKLASSDYGIDSTVWFRIYPKLLYIFFEKCPMALALCRSTVCVRLVQMHEIVVDFSENYKNSTSSIFGRPSTSTPPEVLVNQWKLYLIFACCSLTSTSEQKISLPSQPTHGRKKSLPMYIQHQKITSAKSVFRMVLPLLRSLQPMIREAVISGLSSININICKTLTENLPDIINDWDTQLIKRNREDDRVRIEVVHILSIITSRFRSDSILYSDDSTVANLVSIIKNVKGFLSVPSTQTLSAFQSLRIYFSFLLENVFIGLKDRLDLNRWLPFEARIGCFNFLKEWCGFGDSKSILEERYAFMTKSTVQHKTPAAAAYLEMEKKTLQHASLSCMATICSGTLKQTFNVPGKTAVMSFDIKSVMDWVYQIINSDNEKVREFGQDALKNILESNINSDDIYQEVLSQCYNPQSSLHVRKVYFTNFVKVFLKSKQIELMPYDIFCLSTFLVGTDSYEIRFAAVELLKYLETKFLNTSSMDYFTESVCCSTTVVYKKVLFEISVKLASQHAKDAFTYISYLTKYFITVDNSTRKDILACLLPWVQAVGLNYVQKEDEQNVKQEIETINAQEHLKQIDAPSLMVLNNLFEITVKFSKEMSNEVEALWVALGTNANNFDIICDYIISNCLERRNASFVSYSRQIVAYLVFSKPDPSYVIKKLIANLEPKPMVPFQQHKVIACEVEALDFPYTADISKLLGTGGKESPFSLGQLSMILLVDLFRSNNDMIIEHLPLLLHVSFSLLDHYFPLVQEQSASLIIHLVHSIAPGNPKSLQVMEMLRQKDHHKYLWVYEDLNNDKKGGMTPKNMDLLVRNILEIFAPTVPNLQTEWSRVSLKWATICAVRHIACRSFQLFRSLLSFLDQNMLKDMLHRLSNTIADEGVDIQGFAMQILMTLNAITAELDSEKLIDFPQLFWSSVACLSTIHEHEFIETISTLSKFVSKIDLDAPDTISCLTATFPPKWEGRFEGLQQVVLVGLRSATAWDATIKFLDKLNKLQDSIIIGSGDYRLLMALLTNLPRFLHSFDQKSISADVEQVCDLLSKMAVNCQKASLARILKSLAKCWFRSKKDFLVQTISTIRTSFFPEYEVQTLTILLSFLSNKIPWVKLETLSILKHIIPLADLQREEFLGVGADLISPLLRLLLTEYAEPALEVIDGAVAISGSQLDNTILRMSMEEASMRKEYENTATLFGIPEESGWAVPMPALLAANTRHNVHAVFATCGESTVVDEVHKDSFAGEEIEFLMDEYHAHRPDYADTQSVGVEEPAASFSNLRAALDDFDSFFTKPEQRALSVSGAPKGRQFSNSHAGYHVPSLSVDTKNSISSDLTSPIDSVPQVYDKKALVILNRSLARTQSTTSFKSSLADNYGSPTLFGGPVETGPAKRSYIPFRSSKYAKSKEPLITPKMNSSSSVFDQNTIGTPQMKSPSKTSPSVQYPSQSTSPQETLSPESMNAEAIYRFDAILNGSRKRNRKQ